ncbi:MAG: hypothetical protein H7X95_12310 [Deltaproteobacteria bacterium]|nr:hypothetical protein [Deltaproteobacteria bacterium]
MTSLSSRSTRSRSLLPLLVISIPMWLALACADKHIGRKCQIGLPPEMNTASVNPQALECPSRICLLPAQASTMGSTGPFCTDYCGSDDDCADGEKRSAANPAGCEGGFVCRTPIGKLESPIACKRVCVCKDFVKPDDPDLQPPSCRP